MKSVNKNKRRLMIAVITTIFLILFSMWMFTKATEDVGEDAEVTEESEKTYTPYRNNILGVAGDFCVFTYGILKHKVLEIMKLVGQIFIKIISNVLI